MATSTEQINALIAANTALKQYFESVRADIDSRLNSAASRWDDFETIMHVDQASGDDANDGTAESPLASIQTAIDRVPYGRRGSIRVRGAYTTTERLRTVGRKISLIGCDAGWNYAYIDFTVGYEIDGSDRINTFGFSLEYQGDWDIYYLNILCPDLTVITAAHPDAVTNQTLSALFARELSAKQLGGDVILRYSKIDITANPALTVFSGLTVRFELHSFSQPNPITGHWFPGVAAGTSVASLENVVSNISTL